jgi:hypothetical protein
LITATSYFIIQGPAFFYSSESDGVIAAAEHDWALAGLIICILFFISYLVYQYWLSIQGDEVKELRTEEIIKQRIMRGQISLLGALYGTLDDVQKESTEASPLTATGIHTGLLTRRLEAVLRPFFEKYDVDNSGSIDISELGSVFRVRCIANFELLPIIFVKDLNESLTKKELSEIFRKFDVDGSGSIDYKEFVKGVAEYATSKPDKSAVRGNSCALSNCTASSDLICRCG